MNDLRPSIFLLLDKRLGLDFEVFLSLSRHVEYLVPVALIGFELLQNLLIKPWCINFVQLGF